MICLGDCPPTRRVLIAEFDQVGLDKHFRLVCLEEEGLAILGLGVTAQDQINDFLLVRQRVLPALEACRAKGCDALRMRLNLLFRRHQVVAVEIDSGGARGEREVRDAQLFKHEGFVGAVGDHGIRLAADQVARVAVVFDTRHPGVVDIRELEHRRDIFAARRIHQQAVLQGKHARDPGASRNQEDGRGVLKNRGEHDDWLPARTGDERAGGAHPEVGSAGHNVIDGIHIGPALANLDLEARVAIKAFLKGRIVTGKLELVMPFELQRHHGRAPATAATQTLSTWQPGGSGKTELRPLFEALRAMSEAHLPKAGDGRAKLFDDGDPLCRLDLRGIERQPEPGPGILNERHAFGKRGTGHRIGLDRAFETFDLDRFLGDTQECIPDQQPRLLTDEDFPRLRRSLQPVGKVHLLSDDRIIHALVAAEVADRREPGRDAHAHFEALPDTLGQPLAIEFADSLPHLQRHPHTGHGIFRDASGFRIAKEDQHSISNELVQRAAVLQDHACHAIEVAIQDEGHVLRLHALGLIGESDDIGKEYRELLPAAADSRVLSPLENGLVDLPREIPGELKGEVLQPSDATA